MGWILFLYFFSPFVHQWDGPVIYHLGSQILLRMNTHRAHNYTPSTLPSDLPAPYPPFKTLSQKQTHVVGISLPVCYVPQPNELSTLLWGLPVFLMRS